MKKVILLVMALVLFVSTALAEGLSYMTDEELLTLYQQVSDELAKRNLASSEEEVSDPVTETLKMRLYEFMCLWSALDYPGMVKYCSSEWAAQQEDPARSLYTILKNRMPMACEFVSVSGSPSDTTRSVACNVEIDPQTGKDYKTYAYQISMVLENGLWYVQPSSLETDEIPEPTLVPEQAPVSAETAGGITGDTVLYYNPDGGSMYHLDPNCRRVNEKFIPLQGSFLYADVNDPQYQELEPCDVCGAPERQPDDYNALTAADYTARAWALTGEAYADLVDHAADRAGQVYVVNGVIQEIISKAPLQVLINIGEGDESKPVVIAGPQQDMFAADWEPGKSYRIYGDFVSADYGIPMLTARFSYTE
ncbi:MAG: hypothetical protein IKZ98_13525 [Clostridia bacterium]|nr:hypothetical protein [Clostridia bacterium]